jgi:prolyl oligopeptidase
MYGYGGFEISTLPRYDPILGKGWLEKGNIFVLASIRGGAEFGPSWHTAAIKEHRQNAYDDFIAVAESLIKTGITQPKKLAINGGSNGGLLVGVMLTQRPELFGAVLSEVPVLDMRNYNHFLEGPQWTEDYGDPDIPEQWAYIRKYSPYHNLRVGTKYPDALFITSTSDDRVHPMHASKMAAKMEAMGIPNVWLYEYSEGGHRSSGASEINASKYAIKYNFLWEALGGLHVEGVNRRSR